MTIVGARILGIVLGAYYLNELKKGTKLYEMAEYYAANLHYIE